MLPKLVVFEVQPDGTIRVYEVFARRKRPVFVTTMTSWTKATLYDWDDRVGVRVHVAQ